MISMLCIGMAIGSNGANSVRAASLRSLLRELRLTFEALVAVRNNPRMNIETLSTTLAAMRRDLNLNLLLHLNREARNNTELNSLYLSGMQLDEDINSLQTSVSLSLSHKSSPLSNS